MKNQKGITLVALIITIIVMLILAGVSISLVVGDNGVLTQAQNAGKAQETGAMVDAISLANAGFIMEYWSKTTAENKANYNVINNLAEEINKNYDKGTTGVVIVSKEDKTLTKTAEDGTTSEVKIEKGKQISDEASQLLFATSGATLKVSIYFGISDDTADISEYAVGKSKENWKFDATITQGSNEILTIQVDEVL